jgi:hypothetical protein
VAAFHDFAAMFKREFQLDMQLDKCELYSEGPMDEFGLRNFRISVFKVRGPDQCERAEDHGMLAAGTPIGSVEFVRVHVGLRFSSAESIDVRMPRNMASKQDLFYTARLCGHALVTFILRTVCSSVTIPFALRLTDAYQNFFLCLIGRLDLVESSAWESDDARKLSHIRLF